jgi:hypothetical protein
MPEQGARDSAESTANQRCTEVVLQQMRAVLKPQGFRKQKRAFLSRRGDCTLVINLQGSWYSTRDGVSVTVNVGVFSHPLAERLRLPWAVSVSLWHCHWHERLGFLMPGQRDRWWDASSDAEAFEAGSEIASSLQMYGLPALERLGSTARLYEYYLSEEGRKRFRGPMGQYLLETFHEVMSNNKV